MPDEFNKKSRVQRPKKNTRKAKVSKKREAKQLSKQPKQYSHVEMKQIMRAFKDFYQNEVGEIDKNWTYEEMEPIIKSSLDKIFGKSLLMSKRMSP